ncbi:MAG: ATP-dependent metallopeptidase FtsH/Yme1/Tma family protein, partial [Acidobacteria bacterium]|nr:ATP-dependent metallopeptidase FtsH/Yme1/Tma family protein [Acidobacteriota bacterium]
MSSTARQIIFWLFIVVGALLLYKFLANPPGKSAQELSYTQVVSKLKDKQLNELTIKQAQIDLVDTSNNKFYSPVDAGDYEAKKTLRDLATEMGVSVKQEPSSNGIFWTALITWAPFLLLIGFWIFMLRQMQSGGNKALSFGKSRAKLLNNQQKRVTFKDVAGVEEA